jgi:hypothetical protein
MPKDPSDLMSLVDTMDKLFVSYLLGIDVYKVIAAGTHLSMPATLFQISKNQNFSLKLILFNPCTASMMRLA